MIILHSIWMMSLLWLLPTVSMANSESEKWSWPTSPKQNQHADSRRDVYYENFNDKSGRIRVPTTYYDNNRRPIVSQKYQVKEPVAISATNRPSKPLSDEFSDETFGENGNNINGFSHNNRFPNRFGQQQQAPNDFPGQFNQFYPGSQFGGFPHQGGFGGIGGGAYGHHQQQYPFQGGNFGGYQGNSPANGILVGPGGPTGIFGRPYGRYPNQGGYGSPYGGGGGYPYNPYNQFGGGGYPFQGGFDGGHNGIGHHFGGGGGGPGGFNPYNQFGPAYGFGGAGQQPFFDSTSKNNSGGAIGNKKKVEKSAK